MRLYPPHVFRVTSPVGFGIRTVDDPEGGPKTGDGGGEGSGDDKGESKGP